MRSAYRPSAIRPVNLRKPGAKIVAPVPSETSATGLAKFTFLDPTDAPLTVETIVSALRHRPETVDSVKSQEPDEMPDGAEGKRTLKGSAAAQQLSAYYGQFVAPTDKPKGKKADKPADVPAPVAQRSETLPFTAANGAA